MTRVFVTSDLLESCVPRIQQIKKDFLAYKSSGVLPSYFGRDASYEWPANAKAEEVYHLHIATEGNEWGGLVKQYLRTSDDHLVYSRGFTDPESYLIIAFMSPDAHSKAKNIDLMEQYAKVAHKFRCEY